MKIRTILVLVVTAIAALLVVLNWASFTATTPLTLGFRTFNAPLGLVMLYLTGFMAVLLLGYAMYLRKSAAAQAARQARELEIQRRLAEEAEASRFTELRQYFAEQFDRLTTENALYHTTLNDRLDALEKELRTRLNESAIRTL